MSEKLLEPHKHWIVQTYLVQKILNPLEEKFKQIVKKCDGLTLNEKEEVYFENKRREVQDLKIIKRSMDELIHVQGREYEFATQMDTMKSMVDIDKIEDPIVKLYMQNVFAYTDKVKNEYEKELSTELPKIFLSLYSSENNK